MSHLAVAGTPRFARFSEIDAAAVLFPVAITRRIQRIAFRRGAIALSRYWRRLVRMGWRGWRGVDRLVFHVRAVMTKWCLHCRTERASTQSARACLVAHRMSPTLMAPMFPTIGEVACIAIRGVDARRFAQTQFSGDVEALASGRWQWNAWLTAQGRVRALMHLADIGDGSLLAVLRGGDAAAIHAELSRYVMRMDAGLALHRLTASCGDAVPAHACFVALDGAIVLGQGERSLRLTQAAASTDAACQARWVLHDVRAGWPTLPAGDHDFLPPALGLEHLGAVAFQKGCYPGQEIAARLHYRGGHKTRMHHVEGLHALAPGSWRDGGNRLVTVLQSGMVQDKVETLLVMPVTDERTINILHNSYDVVSIFDA